MTIITINDSGSIFNGRYTNMELLGRSPVEEIFVMCVFNATDIKTD
jgi:hypothetical protein